MSKEPPKLPIAPLQSRVDDETMILEFDKPNGHAVCRIIVLRRGKEVSRAEFSPAHLAQFRNLRNRVLMPAWRAGCLEGDWVLNTWWGSEFGR